MKIRCMHAMLNTDGFFHYGIHTAEALLVNDVKTHIAIFLHHCCIATVDLVNKTYSINNQDWNTTITSRYMKEWMKYLDSEGYALYESYFTLGRGYVFNPNYLVRIASKETLERNGGWNNMDNIIHCELLGKRYNTLKSTQNPVLMYLGFSNDYHVGNQLPRCWLRGKNIQEICRNIAAGAGSELTLRFTEDIPELCALFRYGGKIYLIKYQPRLIAHNRIDTNVNVTYSAVELYRIQPDIDILLLMNGLAGQAYRVYKEFPYYLTKLV